MNKQFVFHTQPQEGTNVRVTVVGVLKENNEMSIGVSRCSKKDQFIRKLGRNIATGRALKNPMVVIDFQPKPNQGELFIEHAKEIAKDCIDNPQWIEYHSIAGA